MQEIEYEDGRKTKEYFQSMSKALKDAEEKSQKEFIKMVKVTKLIPSKKRK